MIDRKLHDLMVKYEQVGMDGLGTLEQIEVEGELDRRKAEEKATASFWDEKELVEEWVAEEDILEAEIRLRKLELNLAKARRVYEELPKAHEELENLLAEYQGIPVGSPEVGKADYEKLKKVAARIRGLKR